MESDWLVFFSRKWKNEKYNVSGEVFAASKLKLNKKLAEVMEDPEGRIALGDIESHIVENNAECLCMHLESKYGGGW